MSEQRSDEWRGQRIGRFTASDVNKLMGLKGLGDTGNTLAFEKACEIVFGHDPEWDVESWDMRRGINIEPDAFECLKLIMAREFLKLEKCSFFPIGENSGSSPDGMVMGKPIIAEIKCPRPNKLFKLIKDGENAIDQLYIDQMQLQMEATNSELCYFFNYCIFRGKPLYHLIKVKRDIERIKLILERIKAAVIIRDGYVKELQTNKQF